jgi:hypothetical protein
MSPSLAAMYAQWAGIDDYEAMRKDPHSSPALEQAPAFASSIPEWMRLRKYLFR